MLTEVCILSSGPARGKDASSCWGRNHLECPGSSILMTMTERVSTWDQCLARLSTKIQGLILYCQNGRGLTLLGYVKNHTKCKAIDIKAVIQPCRVLPGASCTPSNGLMVPEMCSSASDLQHSEKLHVACVKNIRIQSWGLEEIAEQWQTVFRVHTLALGKSNCSAALKRNNWWLSV